MRAHVFTAQKGNKMTIVTAPQPATTQGRDHTRQYVHTGLPATFARPGDLVRVDGCRETFEVTAVDSEKVSFRIVKAGDQHVFHMAPWNRCLGVVKEVLGAERIRSGVVWTSFDCVGDAYETHSRLQPVARFDTAPSTMKTTYLDGHMIAKEAAQTIYCTKAEEHMVEDLRYAMEGAYFRRGVR